MYRYVKSVAKEWEKFTKASYWYRNFKRISCGYEYIVIFTLLLLSKSASPVSAIGVEGELLEYLYNSDARIRVYFCIVFLLYVSNISALIAAANIPSESSFISFKIC